KVMHGELQKLAAAHLRRERAGHSLQPTDIVHEAFLRLMPQKVHWENRRHFYGIASRMMRRILVDPPPPKRAAKREGPSGEPVSPSRVPDPAGGVDIDVLALHEALSALELLDARQGRIMELKYFAGLTTDEIASAVGVSAATVKRDIDSAVV